MLRLNNLKLPLEATSTHIKNAAADKMHCAPQDMQNFKISKKSLTIYVAFSFSNSSLFPKP